MNNKHVDQMIKYFKELGRKYSTYDAFADFIEISAISISNACDKTNALEREKIYLDIAKKYPKEDFKIFADIFAELVLALEEEPKDILGYIFTILRLNDKWKQQVFTPYNVARLMAEFTCSKDYEKIIKDKGYISLSEPCIGAGVNVIAFANTLKDKGINYQKDLLVEGTDIDLRAVHMSYIQLSLLGIPAIITHGNSLLPKDTDDKWYTPLFMINNLNKKYA